ncbi:MAG: hypothetical protein J2P45_25365 [Candidatus Dormibacteraeota bacterium]|nr:hypothetical protein [Candidatus Dormibacteraeota bacterium]
MRFLDFIRDRARYYNCPVCGRNLHDCDMRLVRQVDDRFTVQVTCASCNVQFIVILAVQGAALDSLQDDVLLDPGPEAEVTGVAEEDSLHREPIKGDELLDVHLLLRDFEGRLTDLVQQPSGNR